MARWREIKKGNVAPQSEGKSKKAKKEEKANECNSLLMPRFKAFITDSFMLLMPLMYVVFYFVMGSREGFAEDKLSGWLYIMIPHMIIVISFWYFKGQTPGMKAYEVSIINTQSCTKPYFFRLFNRYVFMTLSIFLVLPLFVPYLNKRGLTLWDLLSGTCIKYKPDDLI